MHDFFQHKTGRAVIVYANLKTGFYDLHKVRKKSTNNRQKRESVFALPSYYTVNDELLYHLFIIRPSLEVLDAAFQEVYKGVLV